MPLLKLSEKDTIALRFKLHDRVSYKCGGAWTTGVVVNKFYRQHSFPPGYCAAYQVRLENGQLVFSPLDDDSMIRAAADGIPEDAKLAPTEIPKEAIAEDEFPLLPITSASTLAAIKQLATGPRDVFIASYPKSGTTWLQAIVFELASLGTDVVLDHISNFTPFLEADRTWTPGGEIAEPAASHQAALGWRGFNTHLLHRHLPAGEKMRILYVIRDAADACRQQLDRLRALVGGDFDYTPAVTAAIANIDLALRYRHDITNGQISPLQTADRYTRVRSRLLDAVAQRDPIYLE